MSAPSSARLSLLALISAILGLLCIPGPIAAITGWIALRAINTSDGRLRGAPLAIIGLVTGWFSIGALALGSVAIVLNSLREKSNRTECMNNLKEISQAVNVSYDFNGHKFPPALLPLAGRPPEEHLSWQAGILPFLEMRSDKSSPWQSLATRLDRDLPWNDSANLPAVQTNVRRYLCPSYPHFDPRNEPGMTHYVGIAGVGADAASVQANNPGAGFFGYDRVIDLTDVTAGASCTFLAVETTADNGRWAAGGTPTVRAVEPDETTYIGSGRAFGGCHRDGSIDVATVGYVDSSVRFLTSSVNPRVFRNSARLAGDPAGN